MPGFDKAWLTQLQLDSMHSEN